jgi:hypothetical protein
MSQKKIVEKIKTHVFQSLFYIENGAVYGKMGKNIVERGRPQMSVWRMRSAG